MVVKMTVITKQSITFRECCKSLPDILMFVVRPLSSFTGEQAASQKIVLSRADITVQKPS